MIKLVENLLADVLYSPLWAGGLLFGLFLDLQNQRPSPGFRGKLTQNAQDVLDLFFRQIQIHA